MTSDHGNLPDAGVDADLASAYRRLATERAPAHLTNNILRSAATAVRARGAAYWLSMIARPLAVASVFALGLLVYQQLSAPGNDGTGVLQGRPLAGTSAPAAGGEQGRRHCNHEQTLSAAAWSACIEALAAAGFPEQAAMERTLLDKTFPHSAK